MLFFITSSQEECIAPQILFQISNLEAPLGGINLKIGLIATLVFLFCVRGDAAQLTVCVWNSLQKPGFSEGRTASGGKVYLGPPLLEMTAPAEIQFEDRPVVSVHERLGLFMNSSDPYFTIPL